MKNLIVISLIFSVSNLPNFCQQNKSQSYFEFGYQYGMVVQDLDFLKGINAAKREIKYFNLIRLGMGFQTDGSRIWHHLYNFPSYGFGIFSGNFNYFDEIGSPIGLFAFFESALFRLENSDLGCRIDIGLAANWNPYQETTNPYNIAIGSKVSAYLRFSMIYGYHIFYNLRLFGGFGFSHFSNGAVKVPNWGLNSFVYDLGIQYDLHDKPNFGKIRIPEFIPKTEFTFGISAGLKQIELDTSNTAIRSNYHDVHYGILNLKSEVLRQISYKSKIGIGIDVTYDASTTDQLRFNMKKENIPATADYSLGVFGTYELVINKFSIIIQPGYYIYKESSDPRINRFYQRIGMKYYVFENLYAGINLRAFDFSAADFTEWGMGYSTSWY